MNFLVILISILLSVICVLLALLQHYYFITKFYKKPSSKYAPEFEDLIPSDRKNLYELGYPIQNLNQDEDSVLNYLTSALKSQPKKISENINIISQNPKKMGIDTEVYNVLQAALAFKSAGKNNKAMKLFEHASAIAPDNADVLNWYGEFLEQQHHDIVTADELYFKALTHCPNHEAALSNRERTAPVVDRLDYLLFKTIDNKKDYLKDRMKLDNFDSVKKQAYYLHIYHTVGIEGNTMTVEQLRYVLETGHVVSGKSIMEHNEILGLEKAMQYVKLLIRTDYIGVTEILGIHRRVMGHVDPIKSGVFRDEKVFIGSHIPPPHEEIPALMENYAEWLNSEEAHSMHPVRYAAIAHYKLVDIHPFVDGNGRTSRLIMNLILLKAGYPPVMILKEQREQYYQALKTANMGDVRPFVRFVAHCTLQILDMYIYGTRFLSIDGSSEAENHVIHY
ncbi:protein adenylyltransferase Fic [Cylas formicarius]|uniref:protein adenylyltransferase Fic n=1 Tax=Cylas formicarius TaxID=197179 RepID=UPI0029584AD9|nr:protein adenylyltransferase Fic [Cylas formicarius]